MAVNNNQNFFADSGFQSDITNFFENDCDDVKKKPSSSNSKSPLYCFETVEDWETLEVEEKANSETTSPPSSPLQKLSLRSPSSSPSSSPKKQPLLPNLKLLAGATVPTTSYLHSTLTATLSDHPNFKQGGYLLTPSKASTTAAEAPSSTRTAPQIVHDYAIFGAYLLEDPIAI